MPTFLLTVEGSTSLWEREGASMRLALATHDDVIAGAVADHGGTLVKSKGEGDSTNPLPHPAIDVSARGIPEVVAAYRIDSTRSESRRGLQLSQNLLPGYLGVVGAGEGSIARWLCVLDRTRVPVEARLGG